MKTLLLTLIISFWAYPCFAGTDEEKGLQIMQEVDRRDAGFGNSRADVKMILKSSSSGEETLRLLRMDTLEVAGDGNKGLSIFDSPRDVKGTAFLSFTHALEPDEQWLYLPALKRVKRISSSNKSGPFVGSEFAFEDLTSFEVPKYKYKYLRDEKVNDQDCFVIELYPQYEESGYTRQISWIDKERYIPLKVEYYDRKDALLKTLEFKGYRQYLNQYWRADEMLMTNHQTGKSTTLLSENFKFRTGLTVRDFDQNTLQRAR
ncbi:outer membrane lipoprotein-sorting protein [Candidatus Methylomicrobium oryzae]|uniref:outer membrane lipoprotein-sorting protein n=1 Tax=Candidatus Methylomicrobium oryzae TaxID=2802053 RepID=UPI0019212064|nr:outer membrane lipoprotein-sorting protein [Methylomicrobium sp. RS1]MBL1264951.1 outer membrane lipoprotein-sorting protein [Methylomicrobium sp. RS1]